MYRRLFLSLLLAAWIPLAAAQAIPKPGAKDLCPVCGMLVSKYPNWVAVVTWKDGHAHFFDGAKDMFKFLGDLAKYAPDTAKMTSRGSTSPISIILNGSTPGRQFSSLVPMSSAPWVTSWYRWPARPTLTTS